MKTLITQMCAKEKVTLTRLLNEISVVLRDEIVAKYEKTDDKILIEFLNGQKFELKLQEV